MAIVYKATCTVSGKSYVGFTGGSLVARQAVHKADAARGADQCRAFHGAIGKHGWKAFTWEVLFEGTWHDALTAESFYIWKCRTMAPHGYNLTSGGEAPKWAQESRDKAARSHAGVRRSEASVEATAAAHRGKKRSVETKQRIAEAKRGKKTGPRPAHVAISLAARHLGSKRTPETCLNISASLRKLTPTQEALVVFLRAAGAQWADIGDWLSVDKKTPMRAYKRVVGVL